MEMCEICKERDIEMTIDYKSGTRSIHANICNECEEYAFNFVFNDEVE